MHHELAGTHPVAQAELAPSKGRTTTRLSARPTRGGVIDKSMVARLSREAILGMTDEELAQVVIAVKPCPNMKSRVSFYDRTRLVQLVFLARHICRRQGY